MPEIPSNPEMKPKSAFEGGVYAYNDEEMDKYLSLLRDIKDIGSSENITPFLMMENEPTLLSWSYGTEIETGLTILMSQYIGDEADEDVYWKRTIEDPARIDLLLSRIKEDLAGGEV